MNLSRAYSLAYDEVLSVGRVQTPTLAMVVERELAVRRFVPEDYLEVMATFRPTGYRNGSYQGTWFRERTSGTLVPAPIRNRCSRPCACPPMEKRRSASRRARAPARPPSNPIEAQTQRMPPPALYDLTELQRHANRLFGFSAQKTLDTAQALYERHKLISYPRTDSRHLSQDVAHTLPRVVDAIAGPYREQLAPGTGERPLGRRFVDDSKVTDHHAIIPTTTAGRQGLAHSRRAQDLRSDLPPPAQRLARRPHLERDHGDHGDPQRRHRGPLSHLGQRGAAGRVEGAGSWRPREGEESRARDRRCAPNRNCRRDSPRASRRTCWTSRS